MAIDVGTTVGEALERVTTAAGAVLVALFAVVGTLWNVALQDLLRETSEQILADIRAYETADAEVEQALRDLETSLEQTQSELHLAVGLDSGAATALLLGTFLASLVLLILAVDAFGRDASSPGELGADGLGWKSLNVVVGTIAYLLLVGIGLVFLVLPGLVVALVLLYFPVAIALDGEWFGEAFGSSLSVFREHAGATLLLVLVIVVAYVVAGIVGSVLGIALPDAASAVLGQVLNAVAWTFTLALLTCAYLSARDEAERAPDEQLTEWAAEDDAA